jgi:hypothetical protein
MAKNISKDVIIERLDNLDKKVTEGFKGVHDRQDTANGKLIKHENSLVSLSVKADGYMTKEDCARLHADNQLKIKESENESIKETKSILWYAFWFVLGILISAVAWYIQQHFVKGVI